MNVSVIITTRNEPLLKWTVDNIRRTCKPNEIIIVYDGLQEVDLIPGTIQLETPWTTPQGVGKCRHMGINYSTSDYVVILDAHMDFLRGWLEMMVKTARMHPNAVICSKSANITSGGMKTSKGILSGAYIRQIGVYGLPLEVEWAEPLPAGRIQCALGACYCFDVARYWAIGEPWANAFGWGTSEQTLCMVNEFCGGLTILADCITGHVYRGNSEIPYTPGADFKTGRAFNRLRLIDMLPIPPLQKDRYFAKAMAFKALRPYNQRALDLLTLTDDAGIKAEMSLSWAEYSERWWKGTEAPGEKAGPQAATTELVVPASPEPINPDKDERFI